MSTKTKRKNGKAWFTKFGLEIHYPNPPPTWTETRICKRYNTTFKRWSTWRSTLAISNANQQAKTKTKRKNGTVWFTQCWLQMGHPNPQPTWLYYIQSNVHTAKHNNHNLVNLTIHIGNHKCKTGNPNKDKKKKKLCCFAFNMVMQYAKLMLIQTKQNKMYTCIRNTQTLRLIK